MSAARLAALVAAVACLSACTPAAQETEPAPSLPTSAMPVAPSLSALAPGSPLAKVPTPTPTPTPTPEPTSPLPRSVLGWSAYRTTNSNGVAVVFYAKDADHDPFFSAGVYPASKSQAEIEKSFPGGKSYGGVWCAPGPSDPKAPACVKKVDASAVLSVGSQGLDSAELAKATQALVDGL